MTSHIRSALCTLLRTEWAWCLQLKYGLKFAKEVELELVCTLHSRINNYVHLLFFPPVRPYLGVYKGFLPHTQFWDLEKNMLHEICVSWTVGSPLLMQKSPTCRDCSVGFEIGNQGLGQISVSVLESI